MLTIAPNDRYASRFERAVVGARARYASVPRGACEPPPAPEPAGRPAPSDGPSQPPPGAGGSLPPPPPDLDCSQVDGPVQVGPGDPHDLDADGDGIGCD